jgi:hypothetical protein
MNKPCWHRGPPLAPGRYLVRPIRAEFLTGLGASIAKRTPVAVVSISDTTDQFDAGEFGGSASSDCWEWSGPINIPDAL